MVNYPPMPETVQTSPEILLLEQEIAGLKQTIISLQMMNENLRAELDQQIEMAAATTKELEDFAHAVSHDLRAPIRAITGFADILVEDHGGQLDEDGLRYLGLITKSSIQMNKLLDALLRYSRLARKFLQPEPLDMNSLVFNALATVRQLYPNQKVEMEIHPLPALVGDRVLLSHVFIILLENAFKFTRHKPMPKIIVDTRQENEKTIYLVRDNGAGFDMEYAPKLFTMFGRLHRQDEYEGAGTGLATAHRIITRQGGRLWAEGRVGEGATFYFTLPAANENI